MQLASVEEAIEALITLHDHQLDHNQHLRVSFSKSTIWPLSVQITIWPQSLRVHHLTFKSPFQSSPSGLLFSSSTLWPPTTSTLNLPSCLGWNFCFLSFSSDCWPSELTSQPDCRVSDWPTLGTNEPMEEPWHHQAFCAYKHSDLWWHNGGVTMVTEHIPELIEHPVAMHCGKWSPART